MKVSRRAEQKNVRLNKNEYTNYLIRKMLENHEVCYFDDNFNQCYDYQEYHHYFNSEDLVVFLDEGDEIKVELFEGYYTNVLIKPDGRKYFITL